MTITIIDEFTWNGLRMVRTNPLLDIFHAEEHREEVTVQRVSDSESFVAHVEMNSQIRARAVVNVALEDRTLERRRGGEMHARCLALQGAAEVALRELARRMKLTTAISMTPPAASWADASNCTVHCEFGEVRS